MTDARLTTRNHIRWLTANTLVSILLIGQAGIGGQARAMAAAVSPHPSVQFAATLLKQGQTEEAIATLRPRIDADPSDCRALGLMAMAYLAQREAQRTRSWIERLQSTSGCQGSAAVIAKMEADEAQRVALAQVIGKAVARGDLKAIEAEIAAAEKSAGVPLLAVRAYVDALKGQFPLLDLPSDNGGLPASSTLIEALRDRQAKLNDAEENLWVGVKDNSLVAVGFGVSQILFTTAPQKDGYRLGRRLREMSTGGQASLQAGKELSVAFARLVRERYNLAPLNQGALGDLMTLAFVSGSSEQIAAVADIMKTAFGRISWWGQFRDDDWAAIGNVTIDFAAGSLSYEPAVVYPLKAGTVYFYPYRQTPIPRLRDHFSEKRWSVPLQSVRQLSQSGTKFANLKAGYRSITLKSSGAVIDGNISLPLPGDFPFYVGLAYGEVPARQVAREYGAQLARLLNVPANRVELIDERPGRGFSFQQLVGAVSGATQGTPNTLDFLSRLSTQVGRIAQERDALRQGDEEVLALWQQAKVDPLLGHALNVGSLSEQIERLLDIK